MLTNGINFDGQDLGVFWHLNVGHFGNLHSGLTGDRAVNPTGLFVKHCLAQLSVFLLGNEVDAVRLQVGLHFIVNFVVNNGRVFRGTDHPVIKSLG